MAAKSTLPKRLNRKRLPKWTRVLTAKQIRHLAECGGLIRAALQANLNAQKRGDCWDCEFAAQRVGIERKAVSNDSS